RAWERAPAAHRCGPVGRTPNLRGAVQALEGWPCYDTPASGVYRVQGPIPGKYAQMGYESSWLGFPLAEEAPLKDLGRFSRFEGGNVYWSPLSGAWAVRNGPIMDAWQAEGFENGRLGFPISDEFPVSGGVQQNFQGGFVTVRDGKAEIHSV